MKGCHRLPPRLLPRAGWLRLQPPAFVTTPLCFKPPSPFPFQSFTAAKPQGTCWRDAAAIWFCVPGPTDQAEHQPASPSLRHSFPFSLCPFHKQITTYHLLTQFPRSLRLPVHCSSLCTQIFAPPFIPRPSCLPGAGLQLTPLGPAPGQQGSPNLMLTCPRALHCSLTPRRVRRRERIGIGCLQ